MATAADASVKSVERAARLLQLLTERGEQSLSELAEATDLVASTAHRILGTLVKSGFVRQDPDTRRYGPGVALVGFADRAVENVERVRTVAVPVMEELAADCHETVLLTILDRREVVFVERVLGSGLVRMDVAPGQRMPAHVTAAGKALLAFQPPRFLDDQLPAEGLEQLTPQSMVDPEAMRRDLASVRARGWAIDYEEQERGVACVGAPILVSDLVPTASLSVSGPTSRLLRDELDALGEDVHAAAAQIARALTS